jgi:hypothetical protein
MRQYLVLKADPRLRQAQKNPSDLVAVTLEKLRSLGLPGDLASKLDEKFFSIAAASSADFRSTALGDPEADGEQDDVVVAYNFTSADWCRQLREFLVREDRLGEITGDQSAIVKNIGADPILHLCSHVPVASSRPFGKRSRVREMMGIDALHGRGYKGGGVNVVIIDRGLNRAEIEAKHPGSWGGGLIEEKGMQPGAAPPTSHGMLIARNVLNIAPEAKVFDVPLIPQHISRPNAFASDATAKIRAVIEDIKRRRRKSEINSAWILVNAWGVFDRASEEPRGDYTTDKHEVAEGKAPRRFKHPLNNAVNDAVNEDIDVVFGSGNCGLFTAISRCGRRDRGPGNSIWGANAHPSVLTVGAVSANDAWIGYSSEGPAPWGGAKKPDVCAPSHFTEDDDPSMVNSGTSTPPPWRAASSPRFGATRPGAPRRYPPNSSRMQSTPPHVGRMASGIHVLVTASSTPTDFCSSFLDGQLTSPPSRGGPSALSVGCFSMKRG